MRSTHHNDELLYFKSKLESFFEHGKILSQKYVEGMNLQKRLDRLLSDTANFVHRKFKNSDLQTLAERMIKYRAEMYTLEYNLEPTNHPAEREVRPAVLMTMIRTAHKKGQIFCKMATPASFSSLKITLKKVSSYSIYVTCAIYLI